MRKTITKWLRMAMWWQRGGVVLLLPLVVACSATSTVPVEERSVRKAPRVIEPYLPVTPAPSSRATAPPSTTTVIQQPSSTSAAAVDWVELPSPLPQQPAYRTTPSSLPLPQPVSVAVEADSTPPHPQPQPDTEYSPRQVTAVMENDDPLQQLLSQIEQAMAAADFTLAESLLQRALRIDSERAGLWHDLGRVRFQQQAWQEVVTLARRSNRLASTDSVLWKENWILIARAREALGDIEGAREAWVRAGE